MTLPPRTAVPRRWVAALTGVPAVWCGFAVVMVLLMLVADRNAAGLYGDPHLYGWWILRGIHHGDWPVITDPSVYPLGALIPMTLPAIVAPGWSQDFEAYRVAYELLVVLMDGLALGALLHAGRSTGRGRTRTLGAWWWLVFLLCLGPISLTRLDGVAAALTVIALAQLIGSRSRPNGRISLAAGLSTLGAWIKIAPAAAWLAIVATTKRPWRRAVVPALVTSAALIIPAGIAILATGGGIGGLSRIFSFLTEQGGRGLQSESVGATPFSLSRLWGSGDVVQLNEQLQTWEIKGPGTAAMATALGVLLIVALAGATFATWRAARRLRETVVDAGTRRVALFELILFATTTLTFLMFVCNKVGSPQFIAWLAPPIAVALTALHGDDRRVSAWGGWLGLALVLPVVGLLTQQLFPAWYGWFIDGDPVAVILAATRNAIVFVLAVWLVWRLVRWRGPVGAASATGGELADGEATSLAAGVAAADDGEATSQAAGVAAADGEPAADRSTGADLDGTDPSVPNAQSVPRAGGGVDTVHP